MKFFHIFVLAVFCSLTFNCKADETNQVSNQESLGTINFTKVPVSEVLNLYAKIAGVELKNEQQIPWAEINFKTTKPLTRAETVQALEKVLHEQAGVVFKPLDAKHIEVTYDESVMVKN